METYSLIQIVFAFLCGVTSSIAIFILWCIIKNITFKQVTYGKWILVNENNRDKRWVCSNCGCSSYLFDSYPQPPYCPYCGAEMKREE